jgi:hypothetical protein
MPLILGTQQAESRRVKVESQLREIAYKSLSHQNPSQKRGR